MAEPFDSRFERLSNMLLLLQSTAGQTTSAMASRFEKSVRQVQRDLDFLKTRGYPIEELGRKRGHRLDPSFRLPQNALNIREVVPLTLGASLSSSPHRQTALAKLRAVSVNGVERLVLTNLPDQVVQPELPSRGEEWLEELSVAISKALRITLGYAGQKRLLEPWSLLYRNSVWYLRALQLDDAVARNFRLNRVESLEVLNHKCELPREHSECFHPWDFGPDDDCRVVVQVTPQLEAWLAENPAHPSQSLHDGRASYVVRNRERFLSWLLGLYGAVLVEPAEWRPLVRERLLTLLDNYKR